MVFYFTGTGNSLYAAKLLEENRFSIPQIMNSDTLSFEDERIGIVCPVYGHEMPLMVKKFIKEATFNTKYFYIILTYGKRHANAVELAKKYVKSVGKQVDYITTVLMADNFLPVFDMAEEATLEKNVETQLSVVKSDITEKIHGFQKVSLEDRIVHNTMMLAFIGKIPEAVWSDFNFTDKCTGCGVCAKVCPAGCIDIENNRAYRTSQGCQACYACIHSCPIAAIKMNVIMGYSEKNPSARYRNANISLAEIITANNQPKRKIK